MIQTTILDYANRHGHVAIFGDQITSPRLDDISVQFQYNIATADIRSGGVVTGSGVVEHDGTNMMRVRAGAGSLAGTATAESVDVVRYRTGHDIYSLFTCRWSAPAAGCTQYIGLFDANDGFGLGYDTSGVFGALYRKGGVSTHIPRTSFTFDKMSSGDGDGSGFVLNPLMINLFRINFGYLGIAPAILEVFWDVKNSWVPFTILEFNNRQTTTHINNPILPMRVEVTSDGSAIVDIHTPSWNAGVIIDRQDEKNNRYFVSENAKAGVSASTNILTLKNQATFQSKTNRVAIELTYLSVSTDGAKNVTFRIRKNSTLGGTPSYASVDSVNSVTQVDTAGTTVSAAEIKYSLQVGKVADRTIDLTAQRIQCLPGETLTISATSASGNDVFVSVGWKELF